MSVYYIMRPKKQLGILIREAGEIFTVCDAATVLGTSNIETAKTLARWTQQGWLTRVRRGLYAVVPIEALDTEQAFEDTWVIIPDLFSPCYIGGWSAAEHWDLTEQLFRDICVLTEKQVIHKKQEIHNIPFMLTHIPSSLNFGTKTIWKKNKKIQVSDPPKTILDMLHTPKLGGGIQHVIDCFKEYINSSHFNPEQLIAYAIKINNGAVFKRLGFLSSKLIGEKEQITILCHEHLTKGTAYIDPSFKEGKLVANWRLIVPTHLQL
jgi:predicted transcriptional regulator of viral defense system